MVMLLSSIRLLFLDFLDNVFLSLENHQISERLLVLSNMNFLLGLISVLLMPIAFSTHPAVYRTPSSKRPSPTSSLRRRRWSSKSSTRLAPVSYLAWTSSPMAASSFPPTVVASFSPLPTFPPNLDDSCNLNTNHVLLQFRGGFSFWDERLSLISCDGFVGLILLHYYT